MKKHHPYVTVLFVPGGCTSLWQPLDVGIQCLLKLSIKRSAHRDLVDEASAQIKAGRVAHEIKIDTTLPTLRDRSIRWIVQAIHDISDPVTITQVRQTQMWTLIRKTRTRTRGFTGCSRVVGKAVLSVMEASASPTTGF
jgi:hypothetical protein